MKSTINLTLTTWQSGLLRAALYVAEQNAWDNVNDNWITQHTAQTLTKLRRELDYQRQVEKEKQSAADEARAKRLKVRG